MNQDSKVLTGLIWNTRCTGEKAMNMHLRGRAHQTREQQAELASVSQQLDSHSWSLHEAPSGPESALNGRDDCAQNQSDNCVMTPQQESISADPFHTCGFLRELVEDVGREEKECDKTEKTYSAHV